MEEWLRGCTYEAVPIRIDDWSALPTDFESGRAGNCLDHALWAWRKLGELGYSAELVVGRRGSDSLGSRHAWVVFEHAGTRHLVETAAKQPDTPMVYDLPEIGDEYWPEFGVDSAGRRFAYGGYLRTLQAQFDAAWHSRGESTGRTA
jgi:hypothetical protein